MASENPQTPVSQRWVTMLFLATVAFTIVLFIFLQPNLKESQNGGTGDADRSLGTVSVSACLAPFVPGLAGKDNLKR